MMDKAAIFTNVTKRNALRKANGLPSLDVHQEYTNEVSVTCHRDYRAACEDHAGERNAIRQQVIADCQKKFGPQFGQTMGGRWIINRLTHEQFATLMSDRYSVSAPDQAVGTRTLTYGGSRTISDP